MGKFNNLKKITYEDIFIPEEKHFTVVLCWQAFLGVTCHLVPV